MFTLHYMLPFLIAGTVASHVALLHVRGSGNSSTVPVAGTEADPFVVYYYKDLPSTREHSCYAYAHASAHS